MEDDLISDYRTAAQAHGAGTQSGEADKANRAYDELQDLLATISASQRDRELQPLLDDEDVWVQLWAAAHTLEVDETLASETLQRLVEASTPLVSMTARHTLQEWNSGTLRFRS